MGTSLEAWLRRRPEGVTLEAVARDFLLLSGPPELLCRIARRSLESIPGLRPGPDGLWRIAAAARALALVTVTTGPAPGIDHLLALGACAGAAGRAGRPFAGTIRPDRPVSPDALRESGVDLTDARAPGEIAGRLAPDGSSAVLVAFSSRRPIRFVRRLLADHGREETVAGEVVLRPALRRAGAIPPRADLSDAAGSLSVVVPSGDDPGDRARAVLEIYLAALDRGIDLAPRPLPAPFDFGTVGFGPELLDRIPESPGVYRFLDRAGELLYVGKAADLRARIRTYFHHRSRRRKRHAELMDRLWRLEWEETGSELAALLREVGEIRERAPPLNVQREVHRRRPAAGDLVLFLPGSRPSRAELLILVEGRLAGRLEVIRRRPAIRRIREALRDALRAPRAAKEDPASAQIVGSWLHAKSDEQNLLDLSSSGGIEEAVRKIVECLADADLFSGKFYR